MYSNLPMLDISSAKMTQFLTKGIDTIEGLAEFCPRKYLDMRTPKKIREFTDGETVVVYAKLIDIYEGSPINVHIEDENGQRMTIKVYGSGWMLGALKLGQSYYFIGKVSCWYGRWYMTNPIDITWDRAWACRIIPIYSAIKGMSKEYLANKIEAAVNFMAANYTEDDDRVLLAGELKLPGYVDALRVVHAPKTMEELEAATQRLAFDKIFDFYKGLKWQSSLKSCVTVGAAKSRAKLDECIKSLPYALTKGQSEAVEGLVKMAMAGERINTLISGDVGCGKTAVAVLASVFMAENGFQTCVMAPTLVLAKQHFGEFSQYTGQFGFKVGLLTSETKAKEKRELLKAVEDGDLDILVGTHAVLSSDLKFHKLGMAIVDEEHKFGTLQKEKLEQFDRAGAHHVSMTATPIPRSMALSIYGTETRVMTIRDMPAGRKTVTTSQTDNLDEVCARIKEQAAMGHQAYVVCPFIESSDDDQWADVWSVEAAEKELKKKLPRLNIASISGNMKQKDVLARVSDFAAGKIDVLISTTIVEVGVNVPNATVIAVLSAERFGLSALHQLRGRVGRGGDQAYCVLLADRHTERLDILCSVSDGFTIAEEDMKLRGPGDLLGIEQTGDNEVVSLIFKWPNMANTVRKWIFEDSLDERSG